MAISIPTIPPLWNRKIAETSNRGDYRGKDAYVSSISKRCPKKALSNINKNTSVDFYNACRTLILLNYDIFLTFVYG